LAGQPEDIWRRALDANLRFYGALGRLTADYFRDLIGVLGGVQATPAAGPAQETRPSPAAPETPRPPKRTAVMVLEEAAGKTAVGVFLVENNLGREVAERPVSSAFVDAAGRKVEPALRFDPEAVALAPGEQLLVRVMAVIDETLEPEVRYQGEVTIPGLTSTAIPIVLRRRAADGPVEAPPSRAAAPNKTPGGRARSKRSAPRRAAGKSR